MIKSMTGFGQSSMDDGQSQLYVEVKSLNSKFLDLNLRLPKAFSDREMEVRNIISEILERGKISVSIDFERQSNTEIAQTYNEPLFTAYYFQLKKLADKVMAPYDELFQLALSSPDVIQGKRKEEVSEELWLKVRKLLTEVLQKCDRFRIDEGKVLETMMKNCCASIDLNLEKIKQLDPKRVARIRERLRNNVTSFLSEEGYDANRLEQEIIFYVEKLD